MYLIEINVLKYFVQILRPMTDLFNDLYVTD